MLKGWVQVATNKATLIVTFVQAVQYYVFGVVEFYLSSVHAAGGTF